LFKLRIDHPVGKSFTTDSDAFQHTVASQLMQHQVGFNQTCTIIQYRQLIIQYRWPSPGGLCHQQIWYDICPIAPWQLHSREEIRVTLTYRQVHAITLGSVVKYPTDKYFWQ